MKRIILMAMLLSALLSLPLAAQRRVSPVNNAATATQSINENKAAGDSIDRSRLVEMTDAQGNKIMVDTVSGREFVDSTMMIQGRVPKMIYPLLHSASVSVDLFAPVMRALGTKYGLVEFAGEVNLHNRYIPVVEVGLGQANNTPEDNNYSYRSPLSVYFRVGANYNILFNSNPDYMITAGLRYGFSPFKFSVKGVTQPGGYWDEPVAYDIPEQRVKVGYLAFVFGLRVKIVGNLSAGWSVNYHKIIHESACKYGKPWYVPGLGTRTSSLGATFSLTYTLPLHKKEAPAISDLPDEIDRQELIDGIEAAEEAVETIETEAGLEPETGIEKGTTTAPETGVTTEPEGASEAAVASPAAK